MKEDTGDCSLSTREYNLIRYLIENWPKLTSTTWDCVEAISENTMAYCYAMDTWLAGSVSVVIVLLLLSLCVTQGVKGSSVPAIERLISVSPSCQPSIIAVSYVDSSGQTVSIESNQDVIGVCGDTIRQISESSLSTSGPGLAPSVWNCRIYVISGV